MSVNNIDSKWSLPFWRQCFVTVGASLNMMSCGFTVAFMPAFLLQLKETNYINISEDQSSWLASINVISEIFGIVMASILMENVGRKKAILFGTVNMVIGWICIIVSTTYTMLMCARFLQGISMGITTILTPVLIGEYTSSKNRGAFLSTISFSLSLGVMSAHSIGLLLTWKTTAAVCASVAIINVMLILFSPESPSFLATHGKFDECKKVFHWLRGLDEEEELEKLTKCSMAIIRENNQHRQSKTEMEKLNERFVTARNVIRRKEFYMPLFLMFHLQIINAWNGSVLWDVYSIELVQNIVGKDINLLTVVQSVDVFRLFLNFISIVISKKMKRRSMLFLTVPFNILTYFIITGYTYCKSHQTLPWDSKYIGLLLIFLHMFSVGVGCIPLPNIIAGEIFSLQFKGISSLLSAIFFSLDLFVHLKSAPHLFSSISFSGTFCMYACIIIYAFVVLVIYLPETKDKILQDIEEDFRCKDGGEINDTKSNQIQALISTQWAHTLPYVNTDAQHIDMLQYKSTVPLNKEDGMGIGPATSGVFPEPPYCSSSPPPCQPSKYRTIDGSCNNLQNPQRWGVSHTPFRRALPADYGDGISSPRQGVDGAPLPSARDVSVTVHRPSYAHDSQFTVMLAVWGQFIDHDVTATALSKGENSSSLSCCDESQPAHPECFPVRLDVEDPFYEEYNLTCMEFVRSAPAPTCNFGPRQQMNQATAFIDGSTVYGFSENRTTRLRTFTGGLLKTLKVGMRELLPPSMDPDDGCNTAEMNAKGRYCFESGDDRANENLHLTTMHLIWARQHNRIATALTKLNPSWDEDTVFYEARRIVGAQMQHITYSELLPNILGVDVMWALNLTLKDSNFSNIYDPTVDPSIANHFSAAAFRFAHTLLPGLIHNANVANGTITYVQLHQMLFNPYALYQDKGSRNSMRSAMDTPVHSVDPHVTAELSNHLFERPVSINSTGPTKPGPCGLDLVSLNIQRGRDHGLPPYPAWRQHCGLSRPADFADLGEIFDEQSMERICTIYKSVDDIDLYTGALAEDPKGRLLGPTLTCLIADQFLRLKVGDRFWYETGDPKVGFTLEQLTEIRKTTLAGVICANEDLLEQAQPRVMEAVSATNPLVDCRELPQPSWGPWQVGMAKGKKGKKKN